ncbi:MAG: AzlD domain-containing protein [Victivallales bacterium]|nr:AzlD domain-containing protein [Victivallales bacterium]
MPENTYLFLMAATMAGVSLLLRAFPFLAFGHAKDGHPPKIIIYLGRVISPAAIAMLVVYCFCAYFKETPLPQKSWGMAELLAGVTVIGLQLWRRNPLLSILAGTALYMFLVQR